MFSHHPKYRFVLLLLFITAYIAAGLYILTRDNHDVLWVGERTNSILQFAGCHYNDTLITADSKQLLAAWNIATNMYHFGLMDVVQEMPKCLDEQKRLLHQMTLRANSPPPKLTEHQIDEATAYILDKTIVVGEWSNRILTRDERNQEESRIRKRIDFEQYHPLESAFGSSIEEAEDHLRLLIIFQRNVLQLESAP